jgi:hypothetical protein
MKNLFDAVCVDELQRRLARLQPANARLWGKMSVTQMLAHCSKGLEMAAGEIRPPRAFIGRVIGGAIKRAVMRDDKPMMRDSPTMRELIIADTPDFETERARLKKLIGGFVAVGPAGCTSHPHAFFGKLAPDEWAILMYKHLDHHLRQFGA